MFLRATLAVHSLIRLCYSLLPSGIDQSKQSRCAPNPKNGRISWVADDRRHSKRDDQTRRNANVIVEACRSNFHSRPERVTCSFAMRHYHEPAGPSETHDPAGWDRASYTPDLLAELGEPLSEPVNGYRQAAIYHLQLMFAVDEFLTDAPDARVAVVAVAVVLGWPSARGLTV